jgi:hydrogenase maturation protease
VTRFLVAGVGNLFFGDDGFGVEVARRLAGEPPPGTRVADFGIRAVHLAFELLRTPELLVVADCVSRGGAPGTLYVIEPEPDDIRGSVGDAHALTLPSVFATVRDLGGAMPPTLVVGCEPDSLEPGIGLSPVVAAAVPMAIDLIRDLISRKESS